MKIHELNTPQKYEKVRELEKKDSIKKNPYMQRGQFLDLFFRTFTLFLFPFYKVSFWQIQFWLGLTWSITYLWSIFFT